MDVPLSEDPEEHTEASGTPGAPDPTAAEQVRVIYREVWEEFYAWEAGHTSHQISSLAARRPVRPAARRKLPDFEPSPQATLAAPGYATITVSDFEGNEEPVVASCPTIIIDTLSPHPLYEACTLSQQLIGLREDEIYSELQALRFIPYADDPTFDHAWYICLAAFEDEPLWQQKSTDPDEETIQHEAMRRLHICDGMSLAEIDKTGILPPSRVTNESGLLWRLSQRDALSWPAQRILDLPHLDVRFEPLWDDLRERLNTVWPYFCPNPSCTTAYCITHTTVNLPILPSRPQKISTEIHSQPGRPCCSECFRKAGDDLEFTEVAWAEDAVAMNNFRALLDLMPDAAPCDLAVILRKPCREIYALRCTHFPDDEIYPPEKLSHPSRLPQLSFKNEQSRDDHERFETPQPCHHEGPCTVSSGCQCYANSVHCSRNCRCSVDCRRRWPGCRCGKRGKTGRSTKPLCGVKAHNACKCVKAGRECDPDLCTCLGARDTKYKLCRNSDMQRNNPARLEIKFGTVGLGAFAAERISRNRYLGEYTGETYPIDSDHREPLRIHADRNYSFTLDKGYLIDGGPVGNETRYFNHEDTLSGNCNVEARVLFVNNSRRIGFWTSKPISVGQELFFDYGEIYWRAHRGKKISAATRTHAEESGLQNSRR
ncbi:SET domain-containing protein [Artomyces pyxidatus]|uniref:SET domain-containing protein n=1 Tax=Artomyces pyxidatus TaxID=48021 RepID=A0ACB8T336_9AGAM|nr:SET domain-containing protein [Artomyces pyxidatus]